MKKINPMSINAMSIILIIITISSVTSRGIVEGYSTCYETIFPLISTYNFNNMYDFYLTLNNYIFYMLFFMALILFIISDFLYTKKSKTKSTILIIFNMLGFTLSLIMFLTGHYIFMTIIVVTMILLQITLQSTNKDKSFSSIISALTGCIWILNIFFLLKHLSIAMYFNQSAVDMTEGRINELVGISRMNIICLVLFLIPCGINIVNQLLFQRKIQKKTL